MSSVPFPPLPLPSYPTLPSYLPSLPSHPLSPHLRSIIKNRCVGDWLKGREGRRRYRKVVIECFRLIDKALKLSINEDQRPRHDGDGEDDGMTRRTSDEGGRDGDNNDDDDDNNNGDGDGNSGDENNCGGSSNKYAEILYSTSKPSIAAFVISQLAYASSRTGGDRGDNLYYERVFFGMLKGEEDCRIGYWHDQIHGEEIHGGGDLSEKLVREKLDVKIESFVREFNDANREITQRHQTTKDNDYISALSMLKSMNVNLSHSYSLLSSSSFSASLSYAKAKIDDFESSSKSPGGHSVNDEAYANSYRKAKSSISACEASIPSTNPKSIHATLKIALNDALHSLARTRLESHLSFPSTSRTCRLSLLKSLLCNFPPSTSSTSSRYWEVTSRYCLALIEALEERREEEEDVKLCYRVSLLALSSVNKAISLTTTSSGVGVGGGSASPVNSEPNNDDRLVDLSSLEVEATCVVARYKSKWFISSNGFSPSPPLFDVTGRGKGGDFRNVLEYVTPKETFFDIAGNFVDFPRLEERGGKRVITDDVGGESKGWWSTFF